VSVLQAAKLIAFGGFVGSALYVHQRGRERLPLRRQITDHSTFLAPYNVLVYMTSSVPQQPILDVADFPELAPLRERWQEIRDEAARLYEAGHVRASERYDDLGFNSFFRKGWKRFYLKWYGAPLPSARELCPRTVELIESIPTVHGAMFALIEPHSKIGNHRDPFAGSVRYHLGLITPNRDECRIFIDGHEYSWRDGKDLVFDETYVHRFENQTEQSRIILFCDVERPIRNPVMRAVNRWVIRNVVGLTATSNMEGERVGLANRIFGIVYRGRLVTKRIKKTNRNVYYALKFGAIAAALYFMIFAGLGALR
jgi:beta-hydroxylase